MKFKELEKLLKKAGWTLYSTRGSHFYYVHPRQPNKVTVLSIVLRKFLQTS